MRRFLWHIAKHFRLRWYSLRYQCPMPHHKQFEWLLFCCLLVLCQLFQTETGKMGGVLCLPLLYNFSWSCFFSAASLLRCFVVQMYTPSQYYASLFEIIFQKSENLTKTPRQLAKLGRNKTKEPDKDKLFVHVCKGTCFGGVFVAVNISNQIVVYAIK